MVESKPLAANVLGTIGTVLCGYRLWKATLMGVVTGLLMGGIEALLILTLRIPYNKEIKLPNLVMGIIAAILLIAGLVAPYRELWKRHGRVIGVNWVFLGMDTAGAVASLLALIAEKLNEPLGLTLYVSIHLIWRARFRELRKEAKAAGVSVDEMLRLRAHHAAAPDRSHKNVNTESPLQGQTTDVEASPRRVDQSEVRN
ncbi:hypothetical protein VTO42DRAFT_5578 [Malbranchea cinnamomea]